MSLFVSYGFHLPRPGYGFPLGRDLKCLPRVLFLSARLKESANGGGMGRYTPSSV